MNKKEFFKNVHKICDTIKERALFEYNNNSLDKTKEIFDSKNLITNKTNLLDFLIFFSKTKIQTKNISLLVSQLAYFKYLHKKEIHYQNIYNIVCSQSLEIENILVNKSIEYETEENAFNNLEIGAELTGLTIQEVCFGYMLKHLVSVYEILTTDKEFSNEVIEEKFNDLINYFIIYEIININKDFDKNE